MVSSVVVSWLAQLVLNASQELSIIKGCFIKVVIFEKDAVLDILSRSKEVMNT